jgi:hypothetical protein
VPQNITDVSTFTAPVVAPADGDPLNAASITAPGVGLQALANRTRFLGNRMGVGLAPPLTDEFLYNPTIARALPISGMEFALSTDAGGVSEWLRNLSGGVVYQNPLANAVFASARVRVPSGSTITGCEVLVRSSGVRTPGNGWFAKLYSQTEPWGAPAAPSAVQQGSTEEGGLSAGYSVIAIGSITPFLIVAGESAHIIVTGPTGALGANDQLLAARVLFNDRGPRNA